MKRNLSVLQSVPYEHGSISSWRALPFNSFVISMLPIKVKSDQAGFSLLDHIVLIQASVDRFMLNYCNKNQPDTPNTPIESLYMNPDLNALLTYKLTVERKAVFATEVSFLIWDRNKATTTYYSAHFFGGREKRWSSPRNRNLI